MLTASENFPDSWDDGEMRTRPLEEAGSPVKVIEGEVDPGEYRKEVAIDQEITVLSGTIYFTEVGNGLVQVYRQGQKFTLEAGRSYVFRFKERFAFRCSYHR